MKVSLVKGGAPLIFAYAQAARPARLSYPGLGVAGVQCVGTCHNNVEPAEVAQ